jgi:hypothetical protein
MPQEKAKAVPRNISLYPQDWTIVRDVARPAGMSMSQALRSIIRDWARMKETYHGQVQPVTEVSNDN